MFPLTKKSESDDPFLVAMARACIVRARRSSIECTMTDEPVPPEKMSPTPRMDQFLRDARPATPCVVLDTDVVRSRYEALRKALREADIFYAVKANPLPEIISVATPRAKISYSARSK
jgi:hypothetical protein